MSVVLAVGTAVAWFICGFVWGRVSAARRQRELRRFIDDRFTADDLDAMRRGQAFRRQREQRHLS